jgi:hypothetical protein
MLTNDHNITSEQVQNIEAASTMNHQNRTRNWAYKALQFALTVVAGVALSVMIVRSAGNIANGDDGTAGFLEDLANHRGNVNNKDSSLGQLRHDNLERKLSKKGLKQDKKSSKKEKKGKKSKGNSRRNKPSGGGGNTGNIGNMTLRHTLRALLEEEMSEDAVFDEAFYEDLAFMDSPNPCDQVDAHIRGDPGERKVCAEYLALPYIKPDCSDQEDIVPKIYYSVGRDATEGYQQLATSAMNPEFVRHHFADLEAMDFVREKCGSDAAEAYACLVAPAFRADLFRFCALYADGGVYLDVDIFPLVPLEELYSPCSIATVGYDYPQDGVRPGKQMKILAAAPGAPIFKCALAQIIEHVRERFYPDFQLELTGPAMLHRCYEQHPEGVAVTYHDTRNAVWPFTGMRQGQKILAYEVPIGAKHFGDSENTAQ